MADVLINEVSPSLPLSFSLSLLSPSLPLSPSPHLPLSLSPFLPLSLSPSLPLSLSPSLPLSLSPLSPLAPSLPLSLSPFLPFSPSPLLLSPSLRSSFLPFPPFLLSCSAPLLLSRLLSLSAPLLLCSSAPLLLCRSAPLLLCSFAPLLLCSLFVPVETLTIRIRSAYHCPTFSHFRSTSREKHDVKVRANFASLQTVKTLLRLIVIDIIVHAECGMCNPIEVPIGTTLSCYPSSLMVTMQHGRDFSSAPCTKTLMMRPHFRIISSRNL